MHRKEHKGVELLYASEQKDSVAVLIGVVCQYTFCGTCCFRGKDAVEMTWHVWVSIAVARLLSHAWQMGPAKAYTKPLAGSKRIEFPGDTRVLYETDPNTTSHVCSSRKEAFYVIKEWSGSDDAYAKERES